MHIGLIDRDDTQFPNLALMKISAYHKSIGDTVDWYHWARGHYDKVYVSKVFGFEYGEEDKTVIYADEVVYGGSGYAITVQNGKEVYNKLKDKDLPYEIEHIYPDYSLYPKLTQDTAYGFLTRGCPRGCKFCIVSEKEGRASRKVANLDEFWRGQKYIKLLDPNILAAREHLSLLGQLADSGAYVDFTQGIDARLISDKNVEALCAVKVKGMHFAFDGMEDEPEVVKGLKLYANNVNLKSRRDSEKTVYILTGYDTTLEEDMHRIEVVIELGFSPYVMVYRKSNANKMLKFLQRWCNNRMIFHTVKFEDYEPIKGKKIKDLLEG